MKVNNSVVMSTKNLSKKVWDLPEKDVELNPWKVDSSDNDEQGEDELDNLGPTAIKQMTHSNKFS